MCWTHASVWFNREVHQSHVVVLVVEPVTVDVLVTVVVTGYTFPVARMAAEVTVEVEVRVKLPGPFRQLIQNAVAVEQVDSFETLV